MGIALALDVLWGAALAGAAVAYVRGYRRVDGAAPRVRPGRLRLAFFLAGLAVIAAAVLTPLETLGTRLVSFHFLGVFLLTMIAAPLLVLGRPLTLALRASGASGRARLRRAVRRGPVAFVTLPPLAWLLFAVVTYLWQFTGLTEAAATNAAVRSGEHVSLVLVGVLFWLPAIGSDPVRWVPVYPLRLLYVIAEMVHKALFGAVFLALDSPLHPGFAERAPSWAPAPMTDQTIAILVAWIGGNLVFVAALACLAVAWTRSDGRLAHRTDKRLAREREAKRRREAALRQVFDR